MYFRLLGPLEVEISGAVFAVTGTRPSAVLSLLLLNSPHVVAAERLVSLLWGDDPPTTAANSLQVHVSALRKVVERGGAPYRVLVSQALGYRMAVEADQVDFRQFELLSEDGRRHLEAGEAAAAVNLFDEALALWRGPALSGLERESWAVPEIKRLEDLRLSIEEDRFDAELRLGRHLDMVNSLEASAARHPLRERLQGLLMLALYRSDRQAEASAVYQRTRDALVDELAMEPGPPLQALLRQILNQEPALEVPAPASATGNLPRPISSFVGRVRELSELKQAIQASPLVTLVGPGGIGKTRLAIEAGLPMQSQFSDGVWFVDLAAVVGDGQVIGQLARSLAVRTVPSEPVDISVRRWLSNKAALIVLDNCEHVIEGAARGAATILSASGALKVLATSREPLSITGEHLVRLDGLAVPTIDGSASADEVLAASSVALLVARAPHVVADEDAATIGEICRRLDGLPLAIELAAARLRTFGPSEVLRRLDDRFDFLTTGSRTSDARHRTLQATLDWSFELLTEKEQRLLECLSAFSSAFDLSAVAAVSPVELADSEELEALASLVEKSLVQRTAKAPDMYRLLETVRDYSGRQLQKRGKAEDVRGAHFEHFLRMSRAADQELWSARQLAWKEQFDLVRDDVRAAMDWGLQTRQPELLAFVRPLVFYSWTRSQLHEIAQWVAAALAALPEATPMRIRALLEYARLLGHYSGDEPLSEAFAKEAIRIQEQLGDFSFRSMADLVMAGCYMELGDLDRAAEILEEAIDWGRKLDDPRQLSLALNDSAYINYQMGVKTSEPEERVREAIALARLHGERYESTSFLDSLAEITLDRDEVAEAATLWSECLEVGELYDDIWSTAMAIQGAAAIARSARNYEAAVLLSSAAAHLREDTRWVLSSSNSLPGATAVKDLRKKLSATRFDELWAAGLLLTRSDAVLEARSVLNRSAQDPNARSDQDQSNHELN